VLKNTLKTNPDRPDQMTAIGEILLKPERCDWILFGNAEF